MDVKVDSVSIIPSSLIDAEGSNSSSPVSIQTDELRTSTDIKLSIDEV